MDHSMIRRYMAMLKSFPEHETVLQRLDDFIVKPMAISQIGHCIKIRRVPAIRPRGMRLDVSKFHVLPEKRLVEGGGTDAAIAGVESYVLNGIYDTVFGLLTEEWKESDERLGKILTDMQNGRRMISI